MRVRRKCVSAAALTIALCFTIAPASAASRVDITNLQDVSLLSLDPFVTASRSQSLCVYSNTRTRGYTITATGSGVASAFTLSGGGLTAALPYTVAWSAAAGQSTGATLSPGVALTGRVSTATQKRCRRGPSTSASLIVRVTAANLQTAFAGVRYTGVLTLVIGAE